MKSKLRLISQNFNSVEQKLLADACSNTRIYRYSEGGSFCLSWDIEHTIICVTWCSKTERVITLFVGTEDCEKIKNIESCLTRLCYDKYYGKSLVYEYQELFQ
jgi:hypothetical protein